MSSTPDVLIVGAGPAGATAALVLARAGTRVLLLDRARFPRPKLCGDTINPGTVRLLAQLGLRSGMMQDAIRLDGMRLTGPRGASVEGRYPAGVTGLALSREVFDERLVREAIAAGAALEENVTVERPLLETGGGQANVVVAGVRGRTTYRSCEWRAPVTIAADGRASALASTLGLTRRPARPARWAIGAYYDGVTGLSTLGEMHVRQDHYIGIAPLPGGLANAILVVPLEHARASKVAIPDLLSRILARDPALAPRFERARAVRQPTILGPLAVDVRPPEGEGLLLAGDAAGFIDPMTGDGMRFAIAGAHLAAQAALDALAHGWGGVQVRLLARRRLAFGRKLAFNKAVRRLTASAAAVRALDASAPLLSPLFSRVISYAGDIRI